MPDQYAVRYCWSEEKNKPKPWQFWHESSVKEIKELLAATQEPYERVKVHDGLFRLEPERPFEEFDMYFYIEYKKILGV